MIVSIIRFVSLGSLTQIDGVPLCVVGSSLPPGKIASPTKILSLISIPSVSRRFRMPSPLSMPRLSDVDGRRATKVHGNLRNQFTKARFHFISLGEVRIPLFFRVDRTLVRLTLKT